MYNNMISEAESFNRIIIIQKIYIIFVCINFDETNNNMN